MKSQEFKLADSVIARIAQLLQEAIITGTDITDHMRMIRLEEDTKHPGVLVQTEAYKAQVTANHKKMLEFAEEYAINKVREAQLSLNGEGVGSDHGE